MRLPALYCVLWLAELLPLRGAAQVREVPEGRVHLSELARRINLTNWFRFGHELADLTTALVARREQTLAAQQTLVDRMVVRRYAQFTSRTTAGHVRAFPWTRPLSEGHPYLAGASRVDNGPAHVQGQDYLKGCLVSAVSYYADKDGWVDLRRLEPGLTPGLTSSPIHRALWWSLTAGYLIDGQQRSAFPPWADLLSFAGTKAARKMLALERTQLVPHDMDALRFVRNTYDKGRSLAGLRVYGIQHLVGNTVGMLKMMALTPRLTELWGKVYSLDPRVGWDLLWKGYRINGDSIQRDRSKVLAQIGRELERIPHPELISKPRILILDDGGEMIELVAKFLEDKPQYAHLFAAVEQTTRGINRLKNAKVPFLVVASATSWAKRTYGCAEYGFGIVKAAVETASLRQEQLPTAYPRTATVIGFGRIGRHVARYLFRRGYDVVVHDTDPKVLARVPKEYRTEADRDAALSRTGLLVSCVGQAANRADELVHKLPQNALVVNGASGDEIVDETGRPLFESSVQLNGTPLNDLQYVHDGRQILFARGGGVINFPWPRIGKANADQPTPGRFIQLELGLLYLAMLQASRGGPPGVTPTPLELAPQRRLVRFIQQRLGQRGESLLDPSW